MTRGAGWFSPPKALARKRSAAAASRLAESKKSLVAPVESTAGYKYTHLPLNRDVGLIHPPTVVGRSEPRSQSALNFWGVTLHPPPDGDVVDRKSALGKEFFHLAVGQREAQVPANRQQDDLRFELPPLEKTRNRRREQEHRTSLSDHASKVATLPFCGGCRQRTSFRSRITGRRARRYPARWG